MKIIVRLTGGIGNQFFQYAAGRSLASRNNGELLLDDSLLRRRNAGVTPRDYALGVYAIRARRLYPREQALLWFRVASPCRYLFDAGFFKSSLIYYREPHFEYDPDLLSTSGDIIIEGYWQSERYFKDIAEDIRNELLPVMPVQATVQEFLEPIRRQNSVSLHVRRGDYVSNASTAAAHVTCDVHYYRRAVESVAACVANPVFFVFTDDPQWVIDNLKIDYPLILVSKPDEWPAYEDLRLMSYCAHNIIANSSFSWWGAWLNKNPDKVVVAPTQWFKNSKNMQDLIPEQWLRV